MGKQVGPRAPKGPLGSFALNGQGLGKRAQKAPTALDGRTNADDQKNAVDFKAAKGAPSKAAMSNPRMDQKPAKTKNSVKGARSPLALGGASPTDAVTRNRLKSASKGAKSTLPLGGGEQTAPIARKLKNEK